MLALLSGQSRQTLHKLKISCMQPSQDKSVFVLDELLKTSKPGTHLFYVYVYFSTIYMRRVT